MSIRSRSILLGFGPALFAAATVVAGISVERSVEQAKIQRVVSLPTADLVLLDSGFEAGLRQGMVCTASRDGNHLGKLLLVELRPRAANALILQLAAEQALQPGDLVLVNTVSSTK